MDQVCPKTGCSSFENTMDKCDKGKLNKAFLYSYKYHQNVGIFDGFFKLEVAEFLNPQLCQYIQGKKSILVYPKIQLTRLTRYITR